MTMLKVADNGKALVWSGNGENLRVEAWGRNSVRVRAALMHDIEDDPELSALLPLSVSQSNDGKVVQANVKISKDGTATGTLRNGNIVVHAQESIGWPATGYRDFRCRLSFTKPDGTLLLKETGFGGSLNLHARQYDAITGGPHAITASFQSPKDEHLYGMGEYQQSVMDLKGSTFDLQDRNSQASVPFVVSSAGYGFLWNNPAVGRATFALNRTEWHADSSRQLDYWVTAADSPADIERQYADATGHAPIMPDWALGFWQCKLRYWNQDQVLAVARRFKKEHIPVSVLVIDFFHWPHMGDYRFEKEFWPDPKKMCDELHKMGIRIMVSVWPQVGLNSENYEEMRQKGLLIRAESGLDIGMMFEGPSQFYDATNPQAREYVWNKCRQNYADMGVDAFWLDEAEPDFGVADFQNYRYHAGPALQCANLYPRDYDRGFYEGQEKIGRKNNIVNLTRCAWAGSQRYGALVWSGDVGSTFADLRHQITIAIHMGMAGIPWFTTDMGGFHDGRIDQKSFRELFLRWAQFETFLPIMRNHGDRSELHKDGSLKEKITAADGTRRLPSGAPNEPWSMGPTVEKILVKFINIREAMRPYVHELFQQAHTDGQPLVRGLFYEFPNDRKATDVADEFLFGPDLLVAPVTEAGKTSRTVYLPGDASTSWTDLRDGKKYAGGTTVTLSAPIDTLPVLARNGRDHGLAGRL